jgi:glycosyltransferase involved in cell wall biosynthesis
MALFIMDAGRNERRLRSDARRLDVAPEVTFVDPQPDMDYQEIIAGADVFLSVPSQGELNLHTLQAMGEGVPVLAGPDEAADFLSDDETAVLCEPMDVEMLTAALLDMLEEPEAVARRTQAALARVRDLHDVAQAAQCLRVIYRQVIEPPPVEDEQDEQDAQAEQGEQEDPSAEAPAEEK